MLQLRYPWADGTTPLRFGATAFLGRLAVLVPRPRVNLLLYYGVLASRAARRAEVVPLAAAAAESGEGSAESDARAHLAASRALLVPDSSVRHIRPFL